MVRRKQTQLIVLAVILAFGRADAAEIILDAAGATFPQPLYEKWFEVYRLKTGTRITYRGIGSGGGIRELVGRNVDFGATDAYLTDAEVEEASGKILHIPTCLGAVAVIYNLPESKPLRLTSKLIAMIFLGRIVNWSDRRIADGNSGVPLPDVGINVVHRSDGSGTTFIFTDYLSKVNTAWRENVGRGKRVEWPVGMGVERNPGVVRFVKKISGAIGYVEMTYAEQHNLPIAAIRNRRGEYILPSPASASLAGNVDLPADARIMITDTPAVGGYPISGFTYLIFYQEQAYHNRTRQRAKVLRDLLLWIITDAQAINRGLLYAPLPEIAARNAASIVRSITHEGSPLAE